jgi:LmbE family N-acetylglucosaminyl deacetylase
MHDPARILAIVCHPDDEVWCSGTLSGQVSAGLDVTLAVACNGNLGGMPDKTPEERAEARGREIACACGMLGINLKWMNIGDDEIMQLCRTCYSDLETRFRDLLREIDPDLLILQPLDDFHHHHRTVAELALNASMNASNPAIVGEKPASSGVPTVLFAQPYPPAPFVPDVWVDITGTYELKIAALMCHESQHPFISGQFGLGLIDIARSVAELHGAAVGARYAEVFSLCRSLARTATIQDLAKFFPW